MDTKIINKTKILISKGYKVLINPYWLENRFSDMTVEEIKKTRENKNQQFSSPAQQELSMRGCRTSFIQFHRYMYSLSNTEIKKLSQNMKQFLIDIKYAEDDSTYCDQMILQDVIHFHLCLRDDKEFSPEICDEIAKDYHNNQKLSENYLEITSEHLIDFTKRLIKKIN